MKPSRVIIGVLFIAYGFTKLAEELGWFYFDWHLIRRFWPVILILLGVWLLVRKQYDQPETTHTNFPPDPQSPSSGYPTGSVPPTYTPENPVSPTYTPEPPVTPPTPPTPPTTY